MATIDVGKLSFTHKGNYDASVAYVEKDVVYYNGSAYIAKTSTTGNLPTSTAHWNLFVLKGTDTSVLTTQGDVLYHDGSSLARLAAGTSGQVLQTGGTGANPSWTTVSSDCVKLASNSFSASSAVLLDGTSVWGASNTYAYHKVILRVTPSDNAVQLRSRLVASGSQLTGSYYSYSAQYWGSQHNTQGASTIKASEAADLWEWTRDGMDEVGAKMWEFTVFNMNYSSSLNADDDCVQIIGHSALNNHDGTQRMHGTQCFGMIHRGSAPSNTTGMQFMASAGTLTGNYHVFGFKK